jgi:3-oxoacyl-(acyl-carrier-protein) synthase
MTAPNPEGVIHCIEGAVKDAAIDPDEIDAINGHLTATYADPHEIKSWSKALKRGPENFPYVNATKSMIGHCLGAAGAIETIAAVLELENGFLHPSINCEDLHPDIEPFEKSVVREYKGFSGNKDDSKGKLRLWRCEQLLDNKKASVMMVL